MKSAVEGIQIICPARMPSLYSQRLRTVSLFKRRAQNYAIETMHRYREVVGQYSLSHQERGVRHWIGIGSRKAGPSLMGKEIGRVGRQSAIPRE